MRRKVRLPYKLLVVGSCGECPYFRPLKFLWWNTSKNECILFRYKDVPKHGIYQGCNLEHIDDELID